MFPARVAVAEEDPSAGAIHRAFEVVHFQLQLGFQIGRDRREHTLAAALCGDVDVTVVRVAAEAVAALLVPYPDRPT